MRLCSLDNVATLKFFYTVFHSAVNNVLLTKVSQSNLEKIFLEIVNDNNLFCKMGANILLEKIL